MKAIFTSITLSFFSCAYAQNMQMFYRSMFQADSLCKVGLIDSAITTYTNSFRKVDYVHSSFLRRLSHCLTKKGNIIEAEFYTQRAEKQLTGTNLFLIQTVDSLFQEDQRVRKSKYSRAWKYVRNNNIKARRYKKFQKLTAQSECVNESNINHLLHLISVHGFLGEEILGDDSYKVTIMLLHFDKDTLNQVLEPILNSALDEGTILPLDYARIIDRHLYNYVGFQKYWTWSCTSKSKFELTESEILKKREEIGVFGISVSQEFKNGMWILKNIPR